MLPLPTSHDPDGLAPDLVKRLEAMPPLNVLWMLARTGWLDEIMATLAVMFDPRQFPARDREVMILRICGFLGVEYPLPQHKVFARTAGLTEDEIEAVVTRDDGRLDAWTVALCNMSEEISKEVTLSEASIQLLCGRYGRNGAAQAIWLMSWFNMLVRFVSSTRIPVETPEVLATLSGNALISASPA